MGRKRKESVQNEEHKKVKMKFLQPKLMNDYNNGMNKVDQTDQL
jgi:hypothetical protein